MPPTTAPVGSRTYNPPHHKPMQRQPILAGHSAYITTDTQNTRTVHRHSMRRLQNNTLSSSATTNTHTHTHQTRCVHTCVSMLHTHGACATGHTTGDGTQPAHCYTDCWAALPIAICRTSRTAVLCSRLTPPTASFCTTTNKPTRSPTPPPCYTQWDTQ